jgi:hypothetical protein
MARVNRSARRRVLMSGENSVILAPSHIAERHAERSEASPGAMQRF